MDVQKDQEYDVEKILDRRINDGKEVYLVKWKNWSNEHNSWVLKEDLNCPTLLKKFFLQRNNKKIKLTVKRHSAPAAKKTSFKRTRQEFSAPDEDSELDDEKIFEKTPKNNNEAEKKIQIDKDFSEKLEKFLRGFGGVWRAVRVQPGKFELEYVKKEDNRKKLEKFRQMLTKMCADAGLKPISIENDVDDTPPPDDFEFILECRLAADITVDKDAVVGCTCRPYCSAKGECCPAGMYADFAYRKEKLIIAPGKPIFECNKFCACDLNCRNRVVQRGRQYKMCIFRTSNDRGWGVKTLEFIKKGSFVMEYVGEIITDKEADVRYEQSGAEYLFDLDFFEDKPDFVVDATYCGNESHFVNHSCDPNMSVYSVFIDHLEVRMPRLALFALRDIAKDEELTFDYAMTNVRDGGVSSDEEDDDATSSEKSSARNDNFLLKKVQCYAKKEIRKKRMDGQVRCLCNAKNCRGFVYLNKIHESVDSSGAESSS